jgi:hypothetical protein
MVIISGYHDTDPGREVEREPDVPRFPALALAAATTLKKLPLLGRFVNVRFALPVAAGAPPAAAIRSVRFKKGLGKFSSSLRSYSGAGCDRGIGAVFALVACGGIGWEVDPRWG